MEESDSVSQKNTKHDRAIVRPQMRIEDFQFRQVKVSPEKLKKNKKGLHVLHTMEGMAVNIYKFQITPESTELNRQLITAMCNEMTHYQDFQVKLFEYGFKPAKMRWMYWMVGFVIGLISRIFGRKAVLKADIKLEAKAVHHYRELLETIDWDEETRRIIEKDQADEHGHINRWKKLLYGDEAVNET